MPNPTTHTFQTGQRAGPLLSWGDLLALTVIAVLLYAGLHLAIAAPAEIRSPEISLAPSALPWYALLSVGRMAAAYALSLLFTLIYGRMAAYNQRAEQILMPLLDVLQSVPILSFLPVVLLGLSAVLNDNVAAELASIVLIFTSQAWNLTFAWYQSLTTLPKDLREAAAIFQLNTWMRFTRLELPFAAISLIWNSMVSWAGGWFFLMAAEIFTVGQRDFRLPGLGAYLREAANQGDLRAVGLGIGTLILVIVLLDQFFWRPLLVWSEKFKIEMIGGTEDEPASWVYSALRSAGGLRWIGVHGLAPLGETLDRGLLRRFPAAPRLNSESGRRNRAGQAINLVLLLGVAYGAFRAASMLLALPWPTWVEIWTGVTATLLRVSVALGLALAWTIPVGVAIGTNRRLATMLQPVVQITASVPATALFPVFLLFLLDLPGGLNLAAVLLMLLGTQWYLLFNIIAGASAIPQDLKYTATLIQLNGWRRWRTLILPALFPYIVTGAITASGGAWNASIVAEYVAFNGRTFYTQGIGSQIAQATASGNYTHLLAATLSMVLAVVLINRFVWRRLYRLAEEKYRME